MNCTVHDSKRNSGDINNSDGELSAAAISTADLTLPANGLLTVDVPVMVAGIIGQQALSSSSKEQALRLLGARALLRCVCISGRLRFCPFGVCLCVRVCVCVCVVLVFAQ